MKNNIDSLPTLEECKEFQETKRNIRVILKELKDVIAEKYGDKIIPRFYEHVLSEDVHYSLDITFPEINYDLILISIKKNLCNEFPVGVYGINREKYYSASSYDEIENFIQEVLQSEELKTIILTHI